MSLKARIESTLSRYFPPKSAINPETISDDVFCIIETKPILLKLYNLSWGGENTNSLISKIVKEHYELENEVDSTGREVRNLSPKSKLIDSHQVFRF